MTWELIAGNAPPDETLTRFLDYMTDSWVDEANSWVLYRIGPPQNLHESSSIRGFQGRGVHFRWSRMSEISTFGDIEFRKFNGRTKGNENGRVSE